MVQVTREALEELKAENLELKLDAIRKEVGMFKDDVYDKLDLILQKTSETNENVGRALNRINKLEQQDTETRIIKLQEELDRYRNETKPWRIISTNKWVRILIMMALSATGLQLGISIKELILALIK